MITFYWSKTKGNFVNRLTGNKLSGTSFAGLKREWYECLWECIYDIATQSDSFDLEVKVSPDLCMLLESSCMFRPDDRYDYELQQGIRGKVMLTGYEFSLCEVEDYPDDIVKVYDLQDKQIGEIKVLP